MKQSKPIVVKLVFSFILIALCILSIMILSSYLFPNAEGEIQQLLKHDAKSIPNLDKILVNLKLVQALQTIGIFLIPALISIGVFYRRIGITLPLTTKVKGRDIFDAIFLIVFANTIMFVIAQYSRMIPWPQEVVNSNEMNQQVTSLLVSGSSYSSLALNLVVVCLLPAICEEFFFRGFLQRVFMKWFKDPHINIFLAAVIFSAVHFDPMMFIPRFLLGALLGYLFYWTGSLWIPMISHFVNNAQFVVGAFIIEKMQNGVPAESDGSDFTVDNFNLILSILIIIMLLFSIYNRHMNVKEYIRIKI
jgi:Predicted metal-dependent membrane protease